MKPSTFPSRHFRLLAAAALAVSGTLRAAEATESAPTNSPAAIPAKEGSATNSPGSGERTGRTETAPAAEPSTFVRFITDRNIFDPDRRPRNPGESRRGPERPRNTVIPSLTLVGVLDSARGKLAFFDGPASEYRKTIGTNRSIAGFTVAEIRNASVVLRPKEGAEFELALGKSHRLDGAEPVEAPAGSSADAASGSGTADNTPPPAASGDAADILKKLMQKREQESK